jgi:hypothetical protein
MSSFRRVDSGKADVNLGAESAQRTYLVGLNKNLPSCPSSLPFSLVFSALETIPNQRAFHPVYGKGGNYPHRQL